METRWLILLVVILLAVIAWLFVRIRDLLNHLNQAQAVRDERISFYKRAKSETQSRLQLLEEAGVADNNAHMKTTRHLLDYYQYKLEAVENLLI